MPAANDGVGLLNPAATGTAAAPTVGAMASVISWPCNGGGPGPSTGGRGCLYSNSGT